MPARIHVALLHEGRVLLHGGALPAWTYDEDAEGEQSSVLHVGADVPLHPLLRLGEDRYLELVGCRSSAVPTGEWVAPTDVPDAELREALLGALADREHPPPLRSPWYLPGWYDEVEAWLDERLAVTGRRRTGPVRVHRAWSISAVLLVPTDAGTLWFKAAGGIFDAEAGLHEVLARRLPHDVPALVATDAERCWLLMEPIAGTEGERADGAADLLARRWAEVQRASLDFLDELVAAGAPRRDAAAMCAGLRRVVADDEVLAALGPHSRAAVLACVPRAEELVHELAGCGLPETLVHGDLHLGNVAYDGHDLRVFDLTDVCVSQPLLDGSHLAHFDAREDPGSDLLAAFADAWRGACPDADVDRAVRLAPVVDLVFQIDTFHRIGRAAEPVSRHELGSATSRLLARLPEAIAALEGR